jgi:hypothetical protein
MKNSILYSLALSVTFLSACDISSGTEEVTVDPGSTPADQANYNDYVANRNDALSVITELDTSTELSEVPENDTASLQGTYGISADDAFEASDITDGELVGDMTMDVDFGAATVSGSLTNNFLDEDGTGESKVVELDGEVSFTGTLDLDDGFYDSSNTDVWQIAASGTGTLTDSTTDASNDIEYRLDTDMYGNFYDASGIGDVEGVGTVGDLAAAGVFEGNIDVTTDGDTIIYDIEDSSAYFVYELED